MENERQQQAESPTEWPAWCMAFTPVLGLILSLFAGIELDWVAWMVIYIALWVIDYANLRKRGVTWAGIIGVLILPPIYLLSRTRELQDGKHYFGVSCFVFLVTAIILMRA